MITNTSHSSSSHTRPHMLIRSRFSAGMLIGIVLWPTSLFGQPQDQKELTSIDSLDQFGEFSQTYYSEPRPDLIPAALRFLDTSSLVSRPDRVSLVTMSLSCILHRPELKGRSWDEELAKLHEATRAVVQTAVASGPDSLLAQVPISPKVNDLNWACFFGSGEDKYLDNIAGSLAYLDERKDLNLFLTGATAQWSLSSNALSHPRVKAKMEQLSATVGPLQEFAAAILSKSPDEIRSETSAVVKDQRQRGVW